MQAQKKFADKGVVFLGFTSEGKDKIEQSKKFLKETQTTWANAYGAEAVVDGLGVTGLPTTFVIGKDGKVAWHDEMGGSLEDAITKALEAKP